MSKSIKQGIQNAIKELFDTSTKTNHDVWTNKAQADADILSVQANTVEAVIDEYNALVEGE